MTLVKIEPVLTSFSRVPVEKVVEAVGKIYERGGRGYSKIGDENFTLDRKIKLVFFIEKHARSFGGRFGREDLVKALRDAGIKGSQADAISLIFKKGKWSDSELTRDNFDFKKVPVQKHGGGKKNIPSFWQRIFGKPKKDASDDVLSEEAWK